MKVTFIGHASLLIEAGRTRIVTDPHFQMRMMWSKRFRAPGLDVEHVRDVDGILLSHGHFDHLDPRTLRSFDPRASLAVPPGLGWLGRRFVNGRCVTLKPWESMTMGDAKITAVPVNHVNFRPGFVFGKGTGYMIELEGLTLFFAGDTSWHDGFAEIGERFDIDVALLPIGPIRPAWFQRNFHMDPDQALRAFRDLGARYLVPIHWGSFRQFFDEDTEAVRVFREKTRSEGLINRVVILEPGHGAVFQPEMKVKVAGAVPA